MMSAETPRAGIPRQAVPAGSISPLITRDIASTAVSLPTSLS